MSKRSRRIKRQENANRKGSQKPPKDTLPKLPGRSQEKPEERRNKVSRVLTGLWTYVGALATLLAFVGGYFLIAPKLSVVPATPLAVSRVLYSTPFIISNDGNFSVYNVKYSCEVIFAHFTDGSTVERSHFEDPRFNKPELPPRVPDNVPCVTEIPGKKSSLELVDADIQIVISFVPKFWFFPIEKRFQFGLYPLQDGTSKWIPEALGTKYTPLRSKYKN